MLLTLLFTELVNRYPRAHPFNLAIHSGHFYSEESSSTKTGQGTWNVWLIGVVEISVDIASGMNWVLKIQIMHRCTGIISGTSKTLLSMVFTEDVLQLVHVELEIICVLLMLAETLSYFSSQMQTLMSWEMRWRLNIKLASQWQRNMSKMFQKSLRLLICANISPFAILLEQIQD